MFIAHEKSRFERARVCSVSAVTAAPRVEGRGTCNGLWFTVAMSFNASLRTGWLFDEKSAVVFCKIFL